MSRFDPDNRTKVLIVAALIWLTSILYFRTWEQPLVILIQAGLSLGAGAAFIASWRKAVENSNVTQTAPQVQNPGAEPGSLPPTTEISVQPSTLIDSGDTFRCAIAFSSKDEQFANRLHTDLTQRGVKCWYAPQDLHIGDRLKPAVESAIKLHDKLLLVLSEMAIESAWVEHEVRTALRVEKDQDRTILFPIRLDDAVMNTTEQWAHDIRRTRHIGDFTKWEDPACYQKSLARLLRDLKVEDHQPML